MTPLPDPVVHETVKDTVRVDARPVVSGPEVVSMFAKCLKGDHRSCSGPRVYAQRDRKTHIEVGWNVCECPCHAKRGEL